MFPIRCSCVGFLQISCKDPVYVKYSAVAFRFAYVYIGLQAFLAVMCELHLHWEVSRLPSGFVHLNSSYSSVCRLRARSNRVGVLVGRKCSLEQIVLRSVSFTRTPRCQGYRGTVPINRRDAKLKQHLHAYELVRGMYNRRNREVLLLQEMKATAAFIDGPGAYARSVARATLQPKSPERNGGNKGNDVDELRHMIKQYSIPLSGPRVLRYWVREITQSCARCRSLSHPAALSYTGNRLCVGKCVLGFLMIKRRW